MSRTIDAEQAIDELDVADSTSDQMTKAGMSISALRIAHFALHEIGGERSSFFPQLQRKPKTRQISRISIQWKAIHRGAAAGIDRRLQRRLLE